MNQKLLEYKKLSMTQSVLMTSLISGVEQGVKEFFGFFYYDEKLRNRIRCLAFKFFCRIVGSNLDQSMVE